MPETGISKEDFEAYAEVIEHGYVDKDDLTAIANAAGLSIKKAWDIMKNYDKYKEEFRG